MGVGSRDAWSISGSAFLRRVVVNVRFAAVLWERKLRRGRERGRAQALHSDGAFCRGRRVFVRDAMVLL